MSTEQNTPQEAPPPSSATSKAKPISIQELNRELTPKTPKPQAERPMLPPIEEQKPSPPRPDFKEAMRKKVTEKPAQAEEPAKEEPKAEAPKETPKKEEPKKEESKPKAEEKKQDAPAQSEEIPEDQRRVLPHDKPETAKRIKAILAERDAARKEAAQAKQEYEKAKSAPATPPEELQRLKTEHETAQGELLRLRRLYELDNDVEFKTKYREPVKQSETMISETLKKYNFSDATLKAIADEGGFGAFSTSNRVFSVQEQDPDNPEQTISVKRTAAELARNWLNGLNVQDSEAIKATLGKQALLRTEEQAAIKAAQDDAKSYFDKQTKAQREAAEQAKAAAEQTEQEYVKWLAKTEAETEFLKDREVPDNANEADKAAAAEHNEFNKQLRAQLKKHPTNAIEYGQLKLEAAESHHLRRTLGQKDARIAELEAELKKAKGAMRTTPRGGSILKGSDKSEAKKPAGEGPTDFKAGLRARILGMGSNEE